MEITAVEMDEQTVLVQDRLESHGRGAVDVMENGGRYGRTMPGMPLRVVPYWVAETA